MDFEAEDEFDIEAADHEVGNELGAEQPSAAMQAHVALAVRKRIGKEVDAIAAAEWEEMQTPELFEQLRAAAKRQLQEQIEAQLAEPEPEPEPEPPQLVYGSVAQFVREKIAPTYRREVTEGYSRHWCPEWWRHGEAISRLEALWRAWEHLRLDPSTGMSVWWRDHADHHMEKLFDPEGPFKACSVRDGHHRSDNGVPPLPCAEPPRPMFPDMRTQPGA